MPQAAPPALLELARRLRQLRQDEWPDVGLTQQTLARALGTERALGPATVSSWESASTPKLPPWYRLQAYAQFFATRRSVQDANPRLLPVDDLTEDELARRSALEKELHELWTAARKPRYGEEPAVQRSWHFADSGPVVLICAHLPETMAGPLATPSNPNYTELLSYADLDALVELHGHIRAENPTMDVYFRPAPEVRADDLTGHVVLLGGVAWNDVMRWFSGAIEIPIRQVEHPSLDTGEIFVWTTGSERTAFLPEWREHEGTGRDLVEDVGLLARLPNPINSSRTLTICNGIHSRGVLGAVRSLTDARLRDLNENYLASRFGKSAFAILMRVPVLAGQTLTPDLSKPRNRLLEWAESAG